MLIMFNLDQKRELKLIKLTQLLYLDPSTLDRFYQELRNICISLPISHAEIIDLSLDLAKRRIDAYGIINIIKNKNPLQISAELAVVDI